jgi:hypothetical protein
MEDTIVVASELLVRAKAALAENVYVKREAVDLLRDITEFLEEVGYGDTEGSD